MTERQLLGWGAVRVFAGGSIVSSVEASRLQQLSRKFSVLGRNVKLGTLQAALLASSCSPNSSSAPVHELASSAVSDREDAWVNLIGSLLQQWLNGNSLVSAYSNEPQCQSAVATASSAWAHNSSAACFIAPFEDELLGAPVDKSPSHHADQEHFLPNGDPLAELDAAVSKHRRDAAATLNSVSVQASQEDYSEHGEPAACGVTSGSVHPTVDTQAQRGRGTSIQQRNRSNAELLGGTSKAMAHARRESGSMKRKRGGIGATPAAQVQQHSNVISIDEAASAAQKTEEQSKAEASKLRQQAEEERQKRKQERKEEGKIARAVLSKQKQLGR